MSRDLHEMRESFLRLVRNFVLNKGLQRVRLLEIEMKQRSCVMRCRSHQRSSQLKHSIPLLLPRPRGVALALTNPHHRSIRWMQFPRALLAARTILCTNTSTILIRRPGGGHLLCRCLSLKEPQIDYLLRQRLVSARMRDLEGLLSVRRTL